MNLTHKQKRKMAKEVLGKYKSLEVTWKRFDCGLDENDFTQIACDDCVICRYQYFLEFARSVGLPAGATVQYDSFLDKYLGLVYGDNL